LGEVVQEDPDEEAKCRICYLENSTKKNDGQKQKEQHLCGDGVCDSRRELITCTAMNSTLKMYKLAIAFQGGFKAN